MRYLWAVLQVDVHIKPEKLKNLSKKSLLKPGQALTCHLHWKRKEVQQIYREFTRALIKNLDLIICSFLIKLFVKNFQICPKIT